MIELTTKEHAKVALKRFLSFGFNLLGGFYIARWITPPGITIITYHRIIEDDHAGICPYISVKKSDFKKQLQFFKKKYSIIPLDEAVDRIKRNTVNKHYLVVTFDDGYRDNYSLGLDDFKSEMIQPTVFVTTGCVDRQEPLWPDQVRQLIYGANLTQSITLTGIPVVIGKNLADRIVAVKAIIAHLKKFDIEAREKYLTDLMRQVGEPVDSERLMLNWNEVKMLGEQGVLIGAHTINHPVLTSVSAQVSTNEIVGSREMLEKQTGRAIKLFAYPNGTVNDFTDATIEQLKDAGYEAAVTTIRGVNRNGEDIFRLRRTGVYLTDSLSVIKFKLALESLLIWLERRDTRNEKA